MHLTKNQIKQTSRIKRLNLINSITGIKPANLIGTVSENGHSNLAIFSSIVHLGSNPALLGFILRPQHEVRRDTYDNILQTKYYTINHIPLTMLKTPIIHRLNLTRKIQSLKGVSLPKNIYLISMRLLLKKVVLR